MQPNTGCGACLVAGVNVGITLPNVFDNCLCISFKSTNVCVCVKIGCCSGTCGITCCTRVIICSGVEVGFGGRVVGDGGVVVVVVFVTVGNNVNVGDFLLPATSFKAVEQRNVHRSACIHV